MTKAELSEIIMHLSIIAKIIERTKNIDPSPCTECTHFKPTTTFCDLYQKEVPDHIEDTGCDKWEWNNIPF